MLTPAETVSPHAEHVIAHGPEFANHPLCRSLHADGYGLLTVHAPTDLPDNASVLLLEGEHLHHFAASAWRARFPQLFIIACDDSVEAADLLVPDGWPERATRKALQTAFQRKRLERRNDGLTRELVETHGRLTQLTEIGTALSAETDIHRLLDRILSDGRRIACCDAASLFLIDERDDGSRELLFKLTQNASIDFPFTERRFPLDETSLAGYVALHGRELNLADVYQIPTDVPYRFHRGIDEAMGYRTVSMLVLPLVTAQRQVIGVLEFINRKDSPEQLLRGAAAAERHTLSFGEAEIEALRALTGQAASAIANNLLVNSLNTLFDGFVAVTVTALEDGDQESAGHGHRVAELAVRVAETWCRRQQQILDSRNLRDLRYACLLHDFGHAGVRKSDHSSVLSAFRSRLAQERERMKRRQLEALLAGKGALLVPDELARLDAFLWAVEKADVPSVRPDRLFEPGTDALFGVASQLRPEARMALDLHLRRSLAFLARLDWRAPFDTIAHHPQSEGEGLPLGARIVLLADLYELLTGHSGLNLADGEAMALLASSCTTPAWRELFDQFSEALKGYSPL